MEELGVDPGELPSPVVAAGASLAAFAVGAIIPYLASGIVRGDIGGTVVQFLKSVPKPEKGG